MTTLLLVVTGASVLLAVLAVVAVSLADAAIRNARASARSARGRSGPTAEGVDARPSGAPEEKRERGQEEQERPLEP